MERVVHFGCLLLVVSFAAVCVQVAVGKDVPNAESQSVDPVATATQIDNVAATPVAMTKPVVPLKKGDAAGAFYVTKVAGADEDGVEAGQELCYRCRYGSRPMVMIFTRHIDGDVTKLVRELDGAIANNKDLQLRGLVTLMGKDVTEVKKQALQIAEKAGVKQVPVVVAKDTANGPVNYRLAPTAEVTVVLASDSKVVSSKTFLSSSIDVASVMSEIDRILH